MDIKKIATQYIEVRNKRNALAKAQKEELKRYDQALDLAEASLLKHLQETGAKNIGVEGATVFRKEQAFVGVADWEVLLDFIKENDLWHLLNKKVSKTGVVEYLEEHKTLVPGTNLRREHTIQVRAK